MGARSGLGPTRLRIQRRQLAVVALGSVSANVRFGSKADIRDVEAGIISSSNKDPITGLPTRSKARRIEAEEIFRGICERVRNAISYVRRQK